MRKAVMELLKLVDAGMKPQIAKREISKKYKLKNLINNIEVLNELTQKERTKYLSRFLTKPVRTGSGVAPVAIMTKPCQCPHVKKGVGPCIMCPGGLKSPFGDVPQSYTGAEPASMRAIRVGFDPYIQVFNRLEQFVVLGQVPEKVELIIMGGTFPATSKVYQESFVKYAFKAMNDFSKLFFPKGEFNFLKFKKFFELPGSVHDEVRVKKVIAKIKDLKKTCELIKEQKRNEKSIIKCIGLVIETRPDYAGKKEAEFMLKLGCTRVELGVQSVFDDVLLEINRGHSVQDIIDSTKLLKDYGFKITYHYMVGLPKSNFNKDIKGFRLLFGSQNFRPDMLKIYPCVLTKGTKLLELYKKKKYKPISVKRTAELVAELKRYVPEYVRIMRVQRDIPHFQIEAGPDRTNMRQLVEAVMTKKGLKCRCIRCREGKEIGAYNLLIKSYLASDGIENFITAEGNDKIFGFCRLRFSKNKIAFVRELHVYGDSVSVGKKGKVQHKGIGKQLLKIAERLSKQEGCEKIIVISGVGVRDYYRKLGYRLENNYMIKKYS